MDFRFFFNSFVLGVGLAADAFSVSLANGLNEPLMKKKKMCAVAGVFGFFQGLMPLLGWFCIHTIVQYFKAFEKLIPWIALGLLTFIGTKMLVDGIKNKEEESCGCLGCGGLLLQGVATSIDALSAGFIIAEYIFFEAFASALIIMAVTFAICLVGLYLGKKFGTKVSNKATIFGGILLILIGIEIFITGLIG